MTIECSEDDASMSIMVQPMSRSCNDQDRLKGAIFKELTDTSSCFEGDVLICLLEHELEFGEIILEEHVSVLVLSAFLSKALLYLDGVTFSCLSVLLHLISPDAGDNVTACSKLLYGFILCLGHCKVPFFLK